jgi:hypothetical protein
LNPLFENKAMDISENDVIIDDKKKKLNGCYKRLCMVKTKGGIRRRRRSIFNEKIDNVKMKYVEIQRKHALLLKWLNVLFTILFQTLYYYDIYTDVVLIVKLQNSGNPVWTSIMIFFVVLPYAVTAFCILQYMKILHKEYFNGVCQKVKIYIGIPVITPFFDVLILFYRVPALGSCIGTEVMTFMAQYEGLRVILEQVFESVPQTCLQLYIYLYCSQPGACKLKQDEESALITSLVVSVTSIFYRLVKTVLILDTAKISFGQYVSQLLQVGGGIPISAIAEDRLEKLEISTWIPRPQLERLANVLSDNVSVREVELSWDTMAKDEIFLLYDQCYGHPAFKKNVNFIETLYRHGGVDGAAKLLADLINFSDFTLLHFVDTRTSKFVRNFEKLEFKYTCMSSSEILRLMILRHKCTPTAKEIIDNISSEQLIILCKSQVLCNLLKIKDLKLMKYLDLKNSTFKNGILEAPLKLTFDYKAMSIIDIYNLINLNLASVNFVEIAPRLNVLNKREITLLRDSLLQNKYIKELKINFKDSDTEISDFIIMFWEYCLSETLILKWICEGIRKEWIEFENLSTKAICILLEWLSYDGNMLPFHCRNVDFSQHNIFNNFIPELVKSINSSVIRPDNLIELRFDWSQLGLENILLLASTNYANLKGIEQYEIDASKWNSAKIKHVLMQLKGYNVETDSSFDFSINFDWGCMEVNTVVETISVNCFEVRVLDLRKVKLQNYTTAEITSLSKSLKLNTGLCKIFLTWKTLPIKYIQILSSSKHHALVISTNHLLLEQKIDILASNMNLSLLELDLTKDKFEPETAHIDKLSKALTINTSLQHLKLDWLKFSMLDIVKLLDTCHQSLKEINISHCEVSLDIIMKITIMEDVRILIVPSKEILSNEVCNILRCFSLIDVNVKTPSGKPFANLSDERPTVERFLMVTAELKWSKFLHLAYKQGIEFFNTVKLKINKNHKFDVKGAVNAVTLYEDEILVKHLTAINTKVQSISIDGKSFENFYKDEFDTDAPWIRQRELNNQRRWSLLCKCKPGQKVADLEKEEEYNTLKETVDALQNNVDILSNLSTPEEGAEEFVKFVMNTQEPLFPNSGNIWHTYEANKYENISRMEQIEKKYPRAFSFGVLIVYGLVTLVYLLVAGVFYGVGIAVGLAVVIVTLYLIYFLCCGNIHFGILLLAKSRKVYNVSQANGTYINSTLLYSRQSSSVDGFNCSPLESATNLYAAVGILGSLIVWCLLWRFCKLSLSTDGDETNDAIMCKLLCLLMALPIGFNLLLLYLCENSFRTAKVYVDYYNNYSSIYKSLWCVRDAGWYDDVLGNARTVLHWQLGILLFIFATIFVLVLSNHAEQKKEEKHRDAMANAEKTKMQNIRQQELEERRRLEKIAEETTIFFNDTRENKYK